MTLRSKFQKNRRAAAAIEFAFSAPLLLAFLFAGIEFSRANMLRNLCDNSALIAARRGMLPGAQASDCIDVANNSLAILGVKNASVAVSPSILTPTTPELTVTIEIPLSENAMPMSKFVMGNTFKRCVTLKREVID